MSSVRLVVCVNERLGLGQKSCGGNGSRALIEIFKQHYIEANIDVVVVEQVCLGRCAEGIVMRLAPGGPFFTQVTISDINKIVLETKRFIEN